MLLSIFSLVHLSLTGSYLSEEYSREVISLPDFHLEEMMTTMTTMMMMMMMVVESM